MESKNYAAAEFDIDLIISDLDREIAALKKTQRYLLLKLLLECFVVGIYLRLGWQLGQLLFG